MTTGGRGGTRYRQTGYGVRQVQELHFWHCPVTDGETSTRNSEKRCSPSLRRSIAHPV